MVDVELTSNTPARRCMMRRFELPVAGALPVGPPTTTRMHRSTRWRDPVLWLGLSVAAAYLGLLSYFLWQIVLAVT
jgi:hypothetical protein